MIAKENKQVVFNYIYLLLIQGTNFILPLITYPYLVRVLGLEKYGIVMVANSLVVFLNILVDFGFNISATREVSLLRNKKQELSHYFWNVFFTKQILVIFSFIFLLVLIIIFDRVEKNAIIYLLSFGLVIGQSVFPTWFFQGIEKMKVITIVNVLAKIIFTVSIFIFIKQDTQYVYIPLLNSLGFLFAGFIGFLLSLKYLYFIKPKRKIIKKLLSENKSLLASNLATSIYTSGNTFILGMIAGDKIAGVYSAMEKLVLATKTLYTPLYQAIFPWLASKKRQFLYKFIKNIRLPIFISSLIIFSFIFFFSDEILRLVYKNTTIISYSNIFKLLGLIAVFSALNMVYLSLFFPAIKEYKKRMIPVVIGGIYNLFTAVIGAYFWGICGVAFAAVTAELLILLLAHVFFKREIK